MEQKIMSKGKGVADEFYESFMEDYNLIFMFVPEVAWGKERWNYGNPGMNQET